MGKERVPKKGNGYKYYIDLRKWMNTSEGENVEVDKIITVVYSNIVTYCGFSKPARLENDFMYYDRKLTAKEVGFTDGLRYAMLDWCDFA